MTKIIANSQQMAAIYWSNQLVLFVKWGNEHRTDCEGTAELSVFSLHFNTIVHNREE